MQVQQRVHFYGSLVLAKLGPGEQGKTEINRGRIQRVKALIEFHSDGVVSIQGPCDRDQRLCKIRKYPPVAKFIRVGKCGASDRVAEPHVVELAITDRKQVSMSRRLSR